MLFLNMMRIYELYIKDTVTHSKQDSNPQPLTYHKLSTMWELHKPLTYHLPYRHNTKEQHRPS